MAQDKLARGTRRQRVFSFTQHGWHEVTSEKKYQAAEQQQCGYWEREHVHDGVAVLRGREID
jgi:hypothetical protein